MNPEYPIQAYKDRVEGWVALSGIVDPTGGVRDPIVLAAEPEGVFDAMALRAFSQWRYCAPDEADGTPEARTALVFQMNK